MKISEDMRMAVKAGAAWLDENHPNWETEINLQDLDMAECGSCIVGQAIGNYSKTVYAQEQVSGDPEWAENHGFEAPVEGGEEEVLRNYLGLEILWTEEVKNRFGN